MAKHDDSRLKCSFCGKTQDQVKKLIAGPEVYICDECVELCNEILDEEFFEGKEKEGASKEKGSSSKEKAIPKPHEIKAYLDEHIVGQDDAKKVLISIIDKNTLYTKLLIIESRYKFSGWKNN